MQGALFSAPDEEVGLHYFEQLYCQKGYRAIAGVDEAGRGPVAGPVVAAAVILPEGVEMEGLNDSKQLSEKKRETLFPLVKSTALAIGVGIVDAATIDEINILQGTLQAMRMAVERLQLPADFLLVDGINKVPMERDQLPLKKGDSRSASVAAASIIAKVVRDKMMLGYDRRYPEYGFAKHKGYGTAEHLAAVASNGVSPIHRRSFRGIKEHVIEAIG